MIRKKVKHIYFKSFIDNADIINTHNYFTSYSEFFNLLYTILKERNPEQLSNLEFQLYQEINSHFTQVLKELETTYPVSQELSWMEKLQKKEQLLNQAREITWQWVLTLKVLQTKYWREYI